MRTGFSLDDDSRSASISSASEILKPGDHGHSDSSAPSTAGSSTANSPSTTGVGISTNVSSSPTFSSICSKEKHLYSKRTSSRTASGPSLLTRDSALVANNDQGPCFTLDSPEAQLPLPSDWDEDRDWAALVLWAMEEAERRLKDWSKPVVTSPQYIKRSTVAKIVQYLKDEITLLKQEVALYEEIAHDETFLQLAEKNHNLCSQCSYSFKPANPPIFQNSMSDKQEAASRATMTETASSDVMLRAPESVPGEYHIKDTCLEISKADVAAPIHGSLREGSDTNGCMKEAVAPFPSSSDRNAILPDGGSIEGHDVPGPAAPLHVVSYYAFSSHDTIAHLPHPEFDAVVTFPSLPAGHVVPGYSHKSTRLNVTAALGKSNTHKAWKWELDGKEYTSWIDRLPRHRFSQEWKGWNKAILAEHLHHCQGPVLTIR